MAKFQCLNISFYGTVLLILLKTMTVFSESNKMPGVSEENKSSKDPLSDSRIINGVETFLEDHPWIVYLEMCRNDGSECSMCGGSIMSKKTLLTARHCVADACDGKIRYGDVNKNKGYEIRFKCEEHSQLHETLDLAIVKLPKGKVFSEKYTRVSIPRGIDEQPNAGDIVYVVGWGRACKENGKECKDQDRHPKELQAVKIKVTPNEQCPFHVRMNFCAGGLDDEGLPKDACSGDSGGPLECEDETKMVYQCGVVSRGPKAPNCGRSPGAYVRIADEKVIKWLIDNGGAQNTKRIAATSARTSERQNAGATRVLSTQLHSQILINLNAFLMSVMAVGTRYYGC